MHRRQLFIFHSHLPDTPCFLLSSANAAGGGHLEVLKWARANGCPWNGWVVLEAKAHCHPHVLSWALANGCPQPTEEEMEGWSDYEEEFE